MVLLDGDDGALSGERTGLVPGEISGAGLWKEPRVVQRSKAPELDQRTPFSSPAAKEPAVLGMGRSVRVSEAGSMHAGSVEGLEAGCVHLAVHARSVHCGAAAFADAESSPQ